MSDSTLTSYRHYKGGTYTLLHIGRNSEKRAEQLAVYVSHQTSQVWVRPLKMFREHVPWPDGVSRRRFTALHLVPDGLDYGQESSDDE